jgi:outer membrane protein OmpA-like peptidoglycan-associated protein
VIYQLQGDVPLGKKPMIQLRATKAVATVRIELTRDDGKTFHLGTGKLAKDATVVLPIGDGASGKATYTGTLEIHFADRSASVDNLRFDTIVRPPLTIGYDAGHLDLDARVLQFKPSRPVTHAELIAVADDGATLGTGAQDFTAATPDGWLAIPWTQPPSTKVMMLKLHAVAADGTATDVQLIPWSVTVAHDDVVFATDSAAIAPAEQPKLDASLETITATAARASKFMKVALYVAGHTDTVGPSAKNRKLSVARARAIAGDLRKHGLTLPIVYAGFGEDVPKIKTPDNTDEPANRRVDYVLGPVGAPPFHGAYLAAHPAWQPLP